MSTNYKWLIPAALGLILVALPVLAQTKKPKPQIVPDKTAIIENTGSTNTLGYKITVLLTKNSYTLSAASSDGSEQNSEMGKPAELNLQVIQLFQDLDKVGPLASILARHGMRSASFGTATFITYKGQRSPDLTFPATAQARALYEDIKVITQALHMGGPRHPLIRPALP